MSKAALLGYSLMDPAAESPVEQSGEVSDETLLDRLARGDSDAIGRLFLRHAPTAYRVALRCTNNAADAEDAVQSAFTQVLLRKAGAQYRGHSRVKGWLMGIVVNTCRMQAREAVSRKAREAQSAEQASSAEKQVGGLAEDALRAVERLPDEYRLPVWLHFVERLTFGEIALALDLSEEAAAKRASRGLERVREMLGVAGATATALTAALGTLPLEAPPATLLASITKLTVTGTAATAAAPGSPGAVAGKSSTLLAGTTAKLAAIVVLAGAATTAAITLAPQDKPAKPAETALPAPQEEAPAGDGKTTAIKSDPKAPLGSPEFYPSPERTIGWRGDGSGSFPGATPPVEWGRWPKGVCAHLHASASKPKAPSAESAGLVRFGAIMDWLVAGPFAGDDPQKAVETPFIADEAACEPNAGVKAGAAEWTAAKARSSTNEFMANMWLDFALMYKASPGQAAYAHTYIHSEAGGSLVLVPCGSVSRLWLNGKMVPLYDEKLKRPVESVPIELRPGWNRMLLKSVCPAELSRYGWRAFVLLRPEKPCAYESKNIAWMVRMPGFSWGSPIVVGDKLYATGHVSSLLCMDKATGKILWIRTSTAYDALTDEEKKQNPAYQEKVAPLVAKLEELNDEYVKGMNAAISPDGLPQDQENYWVKGSWEKKLRDRFELERAIAAAMVGIDRKYPVMNENDCGSANGSPCSDGSSVYAAFGGHSKGPGLYMIVSYTLEGRRNWIFSHPVEHGTTDHGTHTTPVVAAGKVIYGTQGVLRALDAKTGAPAWRLEEKGFFFNCTTPVATKVGGMDVLVTEWGDVIDIAGGKVLSGEARMSYVMASPTLDRGVLYTLNRIEMNDLIAMKLPDAPANKPAKLWQTSLNDLKPLGIEIRPCFMASALYDDGLLYLLEAHGGLNVLDASKGQIVYQKFIDAYQLPGRASFGMTASPTRAGQLIYLLDNSGGGIVLQPGREYKEVAFNRIENINADNFRTERFQSSPVFDGKRMFLRGERYMYCIENKK